MDTKIKVAKELFQNREFERAKQVLVDVVADDDRNYKLLSKFGDICLELKQYYEAQKYYQLSIDSNPSNSSIYMKYGNLLHQHLNDPNTSETMYQKSIELNPNNDYCWFNYAKLLYQQKKFVKAEECLLNCKTEKAAINYYYALILLSMNKPQTQEQTNKVQHLLLQATLLQPNVAKYHHQYALSLIDTPSQYKQAKQAFQSALKLSNNDIKILSDYSKLSYYKDFHAMNDECKPTEIQLIVFAFDEVITYSNLYQRLNGNFNRLKSIRSCDLGLQIFGGYDRVQRLSRFFQRILQSPNNIKIAIVSHNKTIIMTEALKRVSLYRYFNDGNIIGLCDDNKEDICILFHIKQLCIKYNIASIQSVLYVDHDLNNIKYVGSHLNTFYIYNSVQIIKGFSLKDMLNIENSVGIITNRKNMDYVLAYNITVNFKKNTKTNGRAFFAIKKAAALYKPFIHSSIVYYIKHNWSDKAKQSDFITYGQKLTALKTKGCFWTKANILPQLLWIEPKNIRFMSVYGTSLAYLGHKVEAETFLKNVVFRSNGSHWANYLNYASYLFKCNRLIEAESFYRKSETIMNKQKSHRINSIGEVYLGLARAFQWRQCYNLAEKYFQKSLGFSGSHGYYHYAKFLHLRHRHMESKTNFVKAIKAKKWPSAVYQYRFAKTLLALEEYEAYELALNTALYIDPFLNDAKEDIKRYTFRCMNKVLNQGCILQLNSVYQIEFDRFWFDRIEIVNERFNKYYDYIVLNEINDIRYILFHKKIQSKLKDVIGVLVINDFEIIMKNVEKIRKEHQEFLNILKYKHQRRCFNRRFKPFYSLLVHQGIFTNESWDFYGFKQIFDSNWKELNCLLTSYFT